jgi:hypothetical protein
MHGTCPRESSRKRDDAAHCRREFFSRNKVGATVFASLLAKKADVSGASKKHRPAMREITV